MEELAFITLTNDGYIDYTLNLLKSLEIYNLEKKLKCYCIGDKCYNTLTRKGYRAFLLDDKINTNFCRYRTNNWGDIVSKKFDIITENLKTHKYVLITDGDIVFTNRNAINYLLENIEDNDMIIQNSSSNHQKGCSGFLMLRSNEKTIKLFDPKNIQEKKKENKWGDQKYINNVIDEIKYKRLALELYPTGRVYYEKSDTIQPYIIHFNYVMGHKKRETMKKYNHWYLENYKMTLEEWHKIKKPINSLIIQGSPTNGSDSWQTWTIGYNWRFMKLSSFQKGQIQIGNHNELVMFAISKETDRRRRKHADVNRSKIIETLKGFNNKKIKDNEYFKTLSNYKFVISPEGNGIDCHRHYEALMSGSIPICEFNEKTEKKYKNLPVLYTKDYSEINEDYLNKKYREMLKKEYNFDKMFLYYYTKEQQKEIKRCGNYWCNKRKQKNPY